MSSEDASIAWLKDTDAIQSHLNHIDLFDRLEKSDGLIRINNFLPLQIAKDGLKWVKNISEENWEIREVDRQASLRNDDTTQHHFFVKKVFPKLNECKSSKESNRNAINTKHDVNHCLELLIDVIRSIWSTKRSVFSIGKYHNGNYISEHDDHAYIPDYDGVMCSRDLAIIYYLTEDWSEADGGVLVDLHDGKRKHYVPKFNSLVAFEVPRFHEVTAVKRRSGRDPRFSIFGWFLEEGDIYSFSKGE